MTVRLAVSLALGACYGLLSLKAASPFAIPFIAFILVLPLLTWRLAYPPWRLLGATVAFGAGVATVFGFVTVRLTIVCRPPSCSWEGPDGMSADAFLILLPPALLVGAVALGRHLVVRRHRSSNQA